MSCFTARPGNLLILCAIAPALQAATIGDPQISEITAEPSAVSNSRGEGFELYNPSGDAINPYDITLDHDGGSQKRIETDLLILPEYFLVLAGNESAAPNGPASRNLVKPGKPT